MGEQTFPLCVIAGQQGWPEGQSLVERQLSRQ
jgi:hypothetical protein